MWKDRKACAGPTSACSLSCETCQRHSAASASGNAGRAGQGPCWHCISPRRGGMANANVNANVLVHGPRPRRMKELKRRQRPSQRTLESLHDTHAVFLLIRDCGEDCSAADASRSSDSRDSPADIVGQGFASRCRWLCCGEGGGMGEGCRSATDNVCRFGSGCELKRWVG
jgi:hypothetical protein